MGAKHTSDDNDAHRDSFGLELSVQVVEGVGPDLPRHSEHGHIHRGLHVFRNGLLHPVHGLNKINTYVSILVYSGEMPILSEKFSTLDYSSRKIYLREHACSIM